jgi:hypothetical protein
VRHVCAPDSCFYIILFTKMCKAVESFVQAPVFSISIKYKQWVRGIIGTSSLSLSLIQMNDRTHALIRREAEAEL